MTDDKQLVLGTRYQAFGSTRVTAIRFYKPQGLMARRHEGRVYNAVTGLLLVSVTFADTCRGGQWVSVPLPEAITFEAGGEYIVAVDNVLYYAETDDYFASPRAAGALLAVDGVWGFDIGWMPHNRSPSYYHVDIEFDVAVAPEAPPTFNTWPSAGHAHTFYTPADRPDSTANTDNRRPLVLGNRLSVSKPGKVTAFRFYRSEDENAKHHMGRLYDASSGQLLASATFSAPRAGEAIPGWVSVSFPVPLHLVPDKDYVLAIDSVQHYPKTVKFLASPVNRGNLRFEMGLYGFIVDHMPTEPSPESATYWVDGKRSSMTMPIPSWAARIRPFISI